jgi:hypothetical protein
VFDYFKHVGDQTLNQTIAITVASFRQKPKLGHGAGQCLRRNRSDAVSLLLSQLGKPHPGARVANIVGVVLQMQ